MHKSILPLVILAMAISTGMHSRILAEGSFNVTANCPHDFEVAVVHCQHNGDHVEGKGWHKIEARKNKNFGYGEMETNETFWIFVRRVDNKKGIVFTEHPDRDEETKELVDIRVMNGRFPDENGGHLSWRSNELRDQIKDKDNFDPSVWGTNEYTVLRVRAKKTNRKMTGTIILEEDGHVNYKTRYERTRAEAEIPGDKEITVRPQKLKWAANWHMPKE